MKTWTKEQLENFFRQETMLMDGSCKKLAGTLSKDNLIGLILKADPEDYTEGDDK